MISTVSATGLSVVRLLGPPQEQKGAGPMIGTTRFSFGQADEQVGHMIQRHTALARVEEGVHAPARSSQAFKCADR